ncbi:MAG: alpha-L-fucosidase [Victivallales bacterium]|nr:alpha-L-fucosidase [Victivallales bacterium]
MVPPGATPPLAPSGPVPSPRQWRWHQLEFYGFLHFTTNTFTDKEWGYGDESPEIFNPTDFDADAVVTVAREAGMRGLVLTCKHHDGFCLWPSAHTEHSVKNSPWRNGRGDVVREVADACQRQGLLFGIYLSPWDRNHADYGTPAYLDYYRAQLRELLTNYGPIFEVWHDGANGGDGYYGGADEKRTIDKFTYYDWENTWAIVRELQPDAVIFTDVGPDIRWVGNESGTGGETTWLTLNTEGWCPGFAVQQELNTGHEDGAVWLPPEVDVSIRPGWFYHAREDGRVRTVRNLVDMYYQSVGRSGSWHLNLPPDRRGHIHETDVSRLHTLRQILDQTFANDLTAAATATADQIRGEAYAPANVLTDDPDTYWATGDDLRSATLALDLGEPRTFDQVLIQEPVRLGQRVRAWAFDALVDGQWREVATATTIGYKRLARFSPVSAQHVRLRILDAKACPLISRIGLFLAPRFAAEPTIQRAADGTMRFEAPEEVLVRYTLDGTEPTTASPVYEAPFALPDGGVVMASVLAEDNPDVLVPEGRATARATFGLAKSAWSVLAPPAGADALIDDDPQTMWHTAAGEWDVCIDLGETVAVGALAYLPPQVTRKADGFVQVCRWYVSATPDQWGEPVAELRCDNVVNNPLEQRVAIATQAGRYVRVEVLATTSDAPQAVFGGLNVYRDGTA